MDKDKYIKMRKLLYKMIIITFYISFICYLLGDVQSIANWNYGLHEMLYLPINIAFILAPVLGVAWLYYAIKSYSGIKQFNALSLSVNIKNFVIFITMPFIVIFFIVQQNRVTSSGVFEIESKINDGEYYAIMIQEKKVKCTWNEYNLIEEGKLYAISYEWNTYWPDQGRMEYIEIVK